MSLIQKEYDVLKEITIYKDMLNEREWRSILAHLDIYYIKNKNKTQLTLFVHEIELS